MHSKIIDIIGNKHKVQTKAKTTRKLVLFTGKTAYFSRYLGFNGVIELFPIMSIVYISTLAL